MYKKVYIEITNICNMHCSFCHGHSRPARQLTEGEYAHILEQLKGKTIGGTVINTSDDFAMAFLEKELVAVVPCSGFGAPDFVRWTYATSMENIKEGLDRLERFLKS